MFIYQQDENDRLCIQRLQDRGPRSIPDASIEIDSNNTLIVKVEGDVVFTYDLSSGGSTPEPDPEPTPDPEERLVHNAEELQEAIQDEEWEPIVFANDIEISSAQLKDAFMSGSSCSIDMREYTLTITGSTIVEIPEGLNVEITGTINAPEYESSASIFASEEGASLTLKNMDITTSGMVLLPYGGTSTIEGCNLVGNLYVVSTNSSVDSLSPDSEVIIKDSTLRTETNDGDSATVMINCRGNYTIENCTIEGTRQAIIARAGDVTVKNSTITNTIVYDAGVTRCTQPLNWSTGNEVAYGAIVAGSNSNSTGYKADANVVVDNCTLTCKVSEGVEVDEKYAYAIYAIGNLNPKTNEEEGYYQTTVTITNSTIDGNVFIGGTTVDEDIEATGSIVTYTVDGKTPEVTE